MNRGDYEYLRAELAYLEDRLAAIPATAMGMRDSYEARLEEVHDLLRAVPVDDEVRPARLDLVFGGEPVVQSRGVRADFGAVAVARFSEAISAMASSLIRPLAATGKIPDREKYELLVTGTLHGSFGFVLEENLSGQLPLDKTSVVTRAIERTYDVLQGSATDDELVADVLAEVDQRAIDKVRTFIDTLVDHKAVCSLGFENRVFKFRDVEMVQRSQRQLQKDNVHVETEALTGRFTGVLPEHRRFEFLSEGSTDTIMGWIAQDFGDPEDLVDRLRQPVRVRLRSTRVGQSRRRWTLDNVVRWLDDDAASPSTGQ